MNARLPLAAAAAACFAHVLAPESGAAQVGWRDLVVTLGGSVEDYGGNFSAVTVPVIDSTNSASAAVGEVGLRGILGLHSGEHRDLELSFDAGLRQAAAMGFTQRDYTPREWVGSGTLRFQQGLGSWGRLQLRSGFRGRAVSDRPPMPLFLQPGYATFEGGVGLVTRSFDGISFDVQVDGEVADYRAIDLVPQLDLLDRRAVALTGGVRWGGASSVRAFGGYRWTAYPEQGSFDPHDPFRRDRTINLGAEWTYEGPVYAQAGVEGTINRSNSDRPEYDAVAFRALFNAPLPWRAALNLRAVLTAKDYVHATDFSRLVPGEEADNASIAYLQVTRPVADDLDAAVRFGWTRAETDIGGAYYRRIGWSVQFNYRPLGYF